jgi:hypothetical protein
MRFALLLAVAVILVRDPTGKWAGDPLQPWFESLHNKAELLAFVVAHDKAGPVAIRSNSRSRDKAHYASTEC